MVGVIATLLVIL